MPIVVRQLVIRARVEEGDRTPQGNGLARNAGTPTALSQADVEWIVALCVEKVMETLERKKER